MTDIILGIGVAAFIVYTGFHISYILSVKRTSEQMGDFFQKTEGNLNAALAELRETLENVKNITGNVNAVSEDVRQISSTVASVEKIMRGLYEYAKEGLGPVAGANIAGLKAGITTGVLTLVKSFKEGRSDDHEGRTCS
jgi:hypothetical protein